MFKIVFRFVQIWHFCCTMFRGFTFFGHSVELLVSKHSIKNEYTGKWRTRKSCYGNKQAFVSSWPRAVNEAVCINGKIALQQSTRDWACAIQTRAATTSASADGLLLDELCKRKQEKPW